MSVTLWYVSKYLTLPTSRVGGRSYLLLQELAKNSYKIVAFTSNANHLVAGPQMHSAQMRQRVGDVDVVWVRTRRYVGAKSVGRVISWIHFEWRLWRTTQGSFARPNVVIVSSLSLLSILNGLLMRRRYRCALIFEVRDIWPLTLTEEGGYSKLNPFIAALGWLERLAYRASDAVVGTMPNLAEHVREVAGDIATPVFCIPMGVDPVLLEEGESLSPEWCAEHFPRDKFVVCYAGTVGITNALDDIITCAKRMRVHQDIHFLVVGEGDLKETYRQECANLDNISFAPAVPKNQVQALLSKSDVLYFATRNSTVWKYGQSLNKVIDYMLAGKPIIASYSGYRTMINEANCGVYVPSEDVTALVQAVEQMRDMPLAERKAMGARGRAWLLQNRSYDRLAQTYHDLISSTLSR